MNLNVNVRPCMCKYAAIQLYIIVHCPQCPVNIETYAVYSVRSAQSVGEFGIGGAPTVHCSSTV